MARRQRFYEEDMELDYGHEVDPHEYDDKPAGGKYVDTPNNAEDDLNKEPAKIGKIPGKEKVSEGTKSGNILKITEKLAHFTPEQVARIASQIREEDEDEDEEEKRKDKDNETFDKKEESYYRAGSWLYEDDDDTTGDKSKFKDEDEDEDEDEKSESYYPRGRYRMWEDMEDAGVPDRGGPMRDPDEEPTEDSVYGDEVDPHDCDEDPRVESYRYRRRPVSEAGVYASSSRRSRVRYEEDDKDEDEEKHGKERWDGDEDDEQEPANESYGYWFEEDEKDDDGVVVVKDKDSEDDEKDKKDVKEAIRRLRKEDLNIRYNVAGLFEGHNFTDQFKRKVQSDFSTAVLASVKDNMHIIAENEIKSRQRTRANMEEKMIRKIDQYLTYVAEEWVQDNALAIEGGLKVEIMESFFRGMRDLFESHDVYVPERKRDLFDSIAEELEDHQMKLAKQISRNVALREENEALRRAALVNKIGANLTQTQRDKLQSLSESVEYRDEGQFERKLTDLVKKFVVSETVGSATLYAPISMESDRFLSEDSQISGDPFVNAAAKVLRENVL